MDTQVTQALVKVSKESHIKFNGIGAIRAISLTDASAILASKRVDFVVFEEILPEEVEAVKALRNDYRVPMFTFGNLVIDGIENFVCLSDLQDSIQGTTGIWVATYGATRAPRLWNQQFDEYGNEVPFKELEDKSSSTEMIEEISEAEFEEEQVEEQTSEPANDEQTEEQTSEAPAEIETPTEISEGASEGTSETTAEVSEEIIQPEEIKAEEIEKVQESEDFNSIVLSLKTELDYYKKIIKSLETNGTVMEVSKLVEDCTRFEKQIQDLKTKPIIDEEAKKKQDAKTAGLEQTLADSSTQISELNDSIELMESNLSEATKSLEEHKELAEDQRAQLKIALEAFEKVIMLCNRYKQLYASQKDKYEGLLAKYTEVLDSKSTTTADLTAKSLELEEAQRRISELQRTANMKFSELDTKRAELQSEISRLEVEKDELNVHNLENESKIIELTSAINVLQTAKDNLQEELTEVQANLAESTKTIEALNEQLKASDEDIANARVFKEDLSISNNTILELQKEIGKLQVQIREIERLSAEKDRKIGTLQKAKSDAERTAKSFSRGVTIGSDVNLMCNYSGKAYILPVFGSGSYGITTTAVSMAKKLHKEGSSVCLLDFDLVNPKINSFFNKNPLLEYTEEGIDRMYCSCMGLLVAKGTAWFIDHRAELLQTLEQNKKNGKRLDYFSGLYVPVETPKFVSIDYTELFNVLGNDYDFLVVDLGKIGGSDAQNALIRLLGSISLKTTVVCLKEKDDIRNLFVKAQYNKLDSKKFVWLLNMAADTGVSDFMKTMFKLMPYRIMTFSSSMYGSHKTFGTNLIRGMFDELVEDLILK